MKNPNTSHHLHGYHPQALPRLLRYFAGLAASSHLSVVWFQHGNQNDGIVSQSDLTTPGLKTLSRVKDKVLLLACEALQELVLSSWFHLPAPSPCGLCSSHISLTAISPTHLPHCCLSSLCLKISSLWRHGLLTSPRPVPHTHPCSN